MTKAQQIGIFSLLFGDIWKCAKSADKAGATALMLDFYLP